MSWKPPHYVTLGFSLLLWDEESEKIIGMPIEVEEVGEDGLPALIERVVEQFAARGIHPLTEEQYAQFCAALASQKQARRLGDALNARAEGRALSDGEMHAMLRAHKGEPQ